MAAVFAITSLISVLSMLSLSAFSGTKGLVRPATLTHAKDFKFFIGLGPLIKGLWPWTNENRADYGPDCW